MQGRPPHRYHAFSNSYRSQAGWDHLLWNAQNLEALIREHYPKYLSLWKALELHVKRADFARYILMHHYGGLYVDMDSYLKVDLNKFLSTGTIVRDDYPDTRWHIPPEMDVMKRDYDIILGCEKTVWEHMYNRYALSLQKINNAVIFSKSKNQFWIDLIEYASEGKDLPILDSFGVHTFTQFVYRKLVNEAREEVFWRSRGYKEPSILVLPTIYFYENECNDPRQVIVHRYDGNWEGKSYASWLEEHLRISFRRPAEA